MDRSRFKPTSTLAMKKSDEQVNTALGRKDRVGRAGFFQLQEGKNYFRLYPPHPGDELFAYPVVKAMVPIYVQDKDQQGSPIWTDAKKTVPKMRRTVKSVFNARIHGKEGDRDIVEEYVACIRRIAETISNEADRKEYLAPIEGMYIGAKHPKNKMGVNFKETWVCYVNRLDSLDPDKQEFGRLEIGKAIKYRLNELSATEDSDDVIETDPFTDPGDGRAIVVTYDKSATRPQDYYKCEFFTPLLKGASGRIRLYPLSDEQLEDFEKQPSLKSLFYQVYGIKDFQIALQGIQILDEEEGYKLLEDDNFLAIVEEIGLQYPEEEPVKEVADDESDNEVQSTRVSASTSTLLQKTQEIVAETDPSDMFDGKPAKVGYVIPSVKNTPSKEEIAAKAAEIAVADPIQEQKAKAAALLSRLRGGK